MEFQIAKFLLQKSYKISRFLKSIFSAIIEHYIYLGCSWSLVWAYCAVWGPFRGGTLGKLGKADFAVNPGPRFWACKIFSNPALYDLEWSVSAKKIILGISDVG